MMRKLSFLAVAVLLIPSIANAGIFSRKANRCVSGNCSNVAATQVVSAPVTQNVSYQNVSYQNVSYQQNSTVQNVSYQNVSYQNTTVQNVSYGSELHSAQGVANFMARTLQFGHFGNPTGGYEGCGMAGSADAAIRNCCYYGQRPIKDYGVAQGANGMWYACCRYN